MTKADLVSKITDKTGVEKIALQYLLVLGLLICLGQR